MTISPLADRHAPFHELIHAWDLVQRTRRTRAVFVSGERGCGKSRLVAETIAAAEIPYSAIVLGSASKGTPAPYDWLASALTNAGSTTHRPPNVDFDAFAWLTQSRHVPQHRLEPTALRRAARHMVRELLGDHVGVMIVEDLHHLDPASAELVTEIADSQDMTLLLLLLTRPVDSSSYPTSSLNLWKNLHESAPTSVLELEASALGGAGGAVWARYAHRIGCHSEAAAAALRGAADLVAEGDNDSAAALIEEFLPFESAERHPEVSVLASATRRLRQRTEPEPASGEEVALTDREREVLGWLTAGMSNRQIARRLGISVRTVTVHVSNLLRKTQTGSRTEAALWAVEHGMTAP